MNDIRSVWVRSETRVSPVTFLGSETVCYQLHSSLPRTEESRISEHPHCRHYYPGVSVPCKFVPILLYRSPLPFRVRSSTLFWRGSTLDVRLTSTTHFVLSSHRVRLLCHTHFGVTPPLTTVLPDFLQVYTAPNSGVVWCVPTSRTSPSYRNRLLVGSLPTYIGRHTHQLVMY